MTGAVVRVAMWSGPRNISTAMMRAFENRPDTVVVDEPLYAAYLARTGVDHPMRDEVIASQPTDVAAAAAELEAPLPPGRSVHYAKHMAHHVSRDMDLSWTLRFRNVLLIRDPAEVVASYVRARESCEPEDIAVLQQGWLLDLWDEHGLDVPVIDATDFLDDPQAQLRWLCDWLRIPFTDRMLSWPPGPRDSDGVWASHWYAAVWKSTGFQPSRPRDVCLSAHDAGVAQACRPTYERLYARRISARGEFTPPR
jgi:Sulfotransferase domain